MKNKIIITLIIISLIGISFVLNQKKQTRNVNVSQQNITESKNILKGDSIENLIDEQKFEEAQKYYDNILKTTSDPDEKIALLVRKAYIYFLEGENRNEQELFFKKGTALINAINKDQVQEYPEYYRVVGFGYEITKRYDDALKNYFKSIELSTGDNSPSLQTLGGIAHIYMIKGNPYESLKYLSKATNISKDDIFINRLLFRNLGMLARYDDAIKVGEDLLPKISNKTDLSEMYYSLSNLAFLKEDLNKSFSYAQECIKLKEDYGFCHLSLARVYFYGGDKDSLPLSQIEARKALSYNPDSSAIIEFIGLLAEGSGDIDKALFNHTNNLKYFIDTDPNLFENEKVVAKERTLIYLSRLYSKKQEKNSSLYYMNELSKMPINYQVLALLEQEILKKGSDYSYLLKNADLSDYIDLWKSKKSVYDTARKTCKNTEKACINANLYEQIYSMVFEKKEFRKIDLGPLIASMHIKEECTKNNDALDDSLKSICLIFTSSHDYLTTSNTKTVIDNNSMKNVFK